MTPADAMLYLVIAASIAVLVYVKFGNKQKGSTHKVSDTL